MLYAMECQPLVGDEERGGNDEPPASAGSGGAEDSVADVAGTGGQGGQRQPPFSPPGSAYESTLMQLLDGLKDHLPPSSRMVVRCILYWWWCALCLCEGGGEGEEEGETRFSLLN